MPKFSIIIPVYNVAPYLRECLDSVLAQTFTDWEAICIDDGSTDGSGEILDEYAERDRRFRVVHQKNAGVCATRSLALGLARGEWIGFVDSDDWIEPENFAALYAAVSNGSAEMVWCDYWSDKNGCERIRIKCFCQDDAEKHLEALLTDKLRGVLYNKLFSARFIREKGIVFPPVGCDFAEDLVFCVHFLSKSPRVKWLNGCYYHYVAHDGSITHVRNSEKPYADFAHSNEYLCNLLSGTGRDELLRYRKQLIRFLFYPNKVVGDILFMKTFPEICNLRGMRIGWWHHVLFWVSLHGGRFLSVWMIGIIRSMRVKKMTWRRSLLVKWRERM